VLLTKTVNAYSSHGRAALHVGVPVACDDGFATLYGPPVNVSGPLVSVSVLPLVGVVGNITVVAAAAANGADLFGGVAPESGPKTKAAALANKQTAAIQIVLYRTILEVDCAYAGLNMSHLPLQAGMLH